MTKFELIQQLYKEGSSRKILPCYLKLMLERIKEAQ